MGRRRRYVYTAVPSETFAPPAVLPPPGPSSAAPAAPAIVAPTPVEAEATSVNAETPPPVTTKAQPDGASDLAPIEIDDDGVAIIDLTQDDTNDAADSSSSSLAGSATVGGTGSACSATRPTLNMLLPAKAPTHDESLPSWGKVGGIIGWGGIRVPDVKAEGAGPPAKRIKSDAEADDGGGSAGSRATADVCYGQFISTIKGTWACTRTRG